MRSADRLLHLNARGGTRCITRRVPFCPNVCGYAHLIGLAAQPKHHTSVFHRCSPSVSSSNTRDSCYTLFVQFTFSRPHAHPSLLCLLALTSVVACSGSDTTNPSGDASPPASDAGSNAMGDADSITTSEATTGESSASHEGSEERTLTTDLTPTTELTSDAGLPSSTSFDATNASSGESSTSPATDTSAAPSTSDPSATSNEPGTSDDDTYVDSTSTVPSSAATSTTSPWLSDVSDETDVDAGADSGGVPSMNTEDSGPPPDAGVTTIYTDLVLLLKMNEESFAEENRVWDSSGFGNHGSPEGTVAATADGRFGGGAAFDGAGWISVPDAPSLKATTELTLAAWVNLSQRAPDEAPGIIARRRSFGAESAYTLFLWEDNRVYVDVALEDDRFGANHVFDLNTWHHVLVVFDGHLPQSERVKVYVNGNLDTVAGETSSSLAPTSTAIEIGRLVNGGQPWVGTIDEVAIWRRALSAEEATSVPSLDL